MSNHPHDRDFTAIATPAHRIPTPAEMRERRMRTLSSQINEAIAAVENALLSGREVVNHSWPQEVRVEVITRFSAAGWVVTFGDDQCEGAWVRVVPGSNRDSYPPSAAR
jgi:hypothetical protein